MKDHQQNVARNAQPVGQMTADVGRSAEPSAVEPLTAAEWREAMLSTVEVPNAVVS